jgi:hypothetical protein
VLLHLTSSAWFLYNAFSHPTTTGMRPLYTSVTGGKVYYGLMNPPQCCRKERRPSMAVQVPTPEQIKAAATEVGLSLTDTDIHSYIELMRPNVHAYNIVDAMPDYLPVVRYPRTPGSFPPPEENTHNAWYVKTAITGAASGPLHHGRPAHPGCWRRDR